MVVDVGRDALLGIQVLGPRPCLRGRAAPRLSVQKGRLKSWWSMWGGMQSSGLRFEALDSACVAGLRRA